MLRARLIAQVGVLALLASACTFFGNADSEGTDDTAPEAVATTQVSSADTTESTKAIPQTSEAASESTGSTSLDMADVLADTRVRAQDLDIGDCFQINDLEDFWADEVVDCEQPHDGEVLFLVESEVETVGDDFSITAYAQCDQAYLETRGTEFADDPGPLFAFLIDVDEKGQPASDLVCAFHTRIDNGLVGSFLSSSTIDVFQGVVATTELAVGECFLIVDQINVGEPVECGPGTLVSLGVVDAGADFGDVAFPGDDVLRAYRDEKCQPIRQASGVPGEPESVSGVVPDDITWNIHGFRLISCDIEWTEG